jgi:hypothetical protein
LELLAGVEKYKNWTQEPKNANHSWTASPTRGYSLFICSEKRGKNSSNTDGMGLSGRNYETKGIYERKTRSNDINCQDITITQTENYHEQLRTSTIFFRNETKKTETHSSEHKQRLDK